MDGAAGEILGAHGDRQYRIYVQIEPNAIDHLDRSQEFKRTIDNTVYHKGYPTCYRTKGVPSIQISLTRDGTRADIDVDYRSSKFPMALINGHLTASNSDVRAGNNDDRHNSEWAGLQNWWRNLLGLPLADVSPVNMEGKVLAQNPPRKDMKPYEAVHDFLHTWLVEQKPNESFGYFSDEAFACLELGKQPAVDRGMSKFVVVENMLTANSWIGKVVSVKDATEPVSISSPRLKPIQHSDSAEFALYKVREDLAEEFNCANRPDTAEISPKAAKSDDFGKYVGAVFRIHGNDRTGNVVATLWRKDNGYWKLISYKVDPEVDRSTTPNVGVAEKAPPLATVQADPDLVKAASAFLKLWFVKKDVEQALQYVAPECLACVKLYRPDGAAADDRETLKDGMAQVSNRIGPMKTLEEAIQAPEVHHQDMKLVRHRESRAFVLVSIPEYMADAARCDHRDADGNPNFVGGAPAGYGKYYATGFSIHEGNASPAVLWMLWNKGSGSWKAVSYVLVTP